MPAAPTMFPQFFQTHQSQRRAQHPYRERQYFCAGAKCAEQTHVSNSNFVPSLHNAKQTGAPLALGSRFLQLDYEKLFWDVTTCSLAELNDISVCSAYSSTLKAEAVSSSETSTDFYCPKQRHVPEVNGRFGVTSPASSGPKNKLRELK